MLIVALSRSCGSEDRTRHDEAMPASHNDNVINSTFANEAVCDSFRSQSFRTRDTHQPQGLFSTLCT